MPKYLSEEWAQESSAALSSSDAFKSAVTGISLSVQQVVTGGPDGDKSYYMQIDNGEPKIALGEAQTPDVTLTQDYETAVAIAKGELNAQNAFMTGKMKVTGNMAKLMQHQGAFANLEPALKSVAEKTEY